MQASTLVALTSSLGLFNNLLFPSVPSFTPALVQCRSPANIGRLFL